MLLALVLVLGACSKGEERDVANEERLLQARSDPAVQLLPPDALVVDRGQLIPCQRGSRSDNWGEVVIVFESDSSFADISAFYRSRLSALGWMEVASSAYGIETLVFTTDKDTATLRLSTVGSRVGRYMLLAEIPPASDC